MGLGYKNFVKGIGVVPKGTTSSNSLGDLEVLNTDNKLRFHNGTLSDPLVSETVSATLTNKVLTGNTAANLINGSGQLNLNSSGTITVPNGTDTLVGLSLSQTLTNKVLTGNTASNLLHASGGQLNLNGSGTITVPNGTDTLVGLALSQTLTNKTIDGNNNTLSNIANSSLVNSSITINGNSISLGGSATFTAVTTNALTIGTGLTGTSFNGSAAVTIAIDSSVVTLSGVQTLTNKTLTSPSINIINGVSNLLTINASAGLTLNNVTVGDRTISVTSGTLQLGASGQSVLITSDQAAGVVLDATSSAFVEFRKNGTAISFVDTDGLVLLNQNSLKLRESSGNGTNSVNIRAASSMASDYTITMPAASPGTNTALVFDGANYVWGVVSGGYTSSVQTTLTAGGTITISTSDKQQAIEVQGNGGAVTLSTTPFGTTDPSDKTTIRLIGRSSTNTVTLVNSDTANGCLLNGNCTLTLGDTIELMYIASIDRYIEISRS